MPIATSVREQVSQLPCKHLGTIDYFESPSTANYNASFINITPQEQEYVDSMFSKNVGDVEGLDLEQLNLATTSVSGQIRPVPVAVPLLPDFLCNHINCTVDVRIPRYDLYDNENVYQRKVWGTDVYTDDSDVVAILYHCGILTSTDPLADLQSLKSREKSRSKPKAKSKEKSKDGINAAQLTASSSLSSTSSSAPATASPTSPRYPVQPDNADEDISDMLIVRLRILPPLTAYNGSYRHCYNSRSWNGSVLHDGASVSVDSVRWCRKCNMGGWS